MRKKLQQTSVLGLVCVIVCSCAEAPPLPNGGTGGSGGSGESTTSMGGSGNTANGGAALGGQAITGGAATGTSPATGGGTSTVTCSGTMPTGGTVHTGNTQGGAGSVAWSLWANGNGGNITTYSTPAFSASWNNSGDFLARMGLEWGNSGKTYDQFGTITAQFAYKKTGSRWRLLVYRNLRVVNKPMR